MDADIGQIQIQDGETATTIAAVVYAWQLAQGPPMRQPKIAILWDAVLIEGKPYRRMCELPSPKAVLLWSQSPMRLQ
jgi:hypothetical protein